MTMIRVLLCIAMLAVPFAVAADDEEACIVAPADITVELAPDLTVVWRISGGAHIFDATQPSAALTNVPVLTNVPLTPEATVEPEATPEMKPALQPYQAVTVPPETCVASELDGVLAQSSGEALAPVAVNGVDILLGGTAFIRPLDDDTLVINVLDGCAIAGEAHISAGAAATIVTDAETTLAPYDDEALAWLFLTESAGSDFRATALTPAPDAVEQAECRVTSAG